MTKPPTDYGPRQLGDRLDLPEWQLLRALRLELIPAVDAGGRWPAAVVNDAVERLDAIRAAVGTLPDIGATRAEEHLAARFRLDVAPGTAAELSRRGHLPLRGHYKGYPLYCGLALEGPGLDRRKVQRASAAGHLHMRDRAAEILEVRAADFDHLVRAGLLAPTETVRSSYHRRTLVPLYRRGDLDSLLRSSRIDWDAVRATPPGRPSPLAQLPTRAANTSA
ncbi:hypothetical protein [Kitasatospora sp. A2-31]|uniref:hypothetical protein n=1 Tax=Kitasatospora sp. A2-31 TaxID=2916414 RepID=UPI001EEB48B6|nr:hypothetical protein [Kitasatospora sp. A2-31]MCG6496621.1 hypothetical protein [Kitasatospora sp. A2-31]